MVEYFLVEDSEGDNNRGWRVDEIVALDGSELVGYIKASYIPLERFQAHYPTIVQYLGKIKGKMILPYGVETVEDCNEEQLLAACSRLAYETLPWSVAAENSTMLSRYSRETLMTFWNASLPTLVEKHQRSFEEFEDHHVDKPIVDFVRVGRPYQRQGYATTLYFEMARHLADQGLTLRASGVQEDAASNWWTKMEKVGLVAKGTDNRRYLCVS